MRDRPPAGADSGTSTRTVALAIRSGALAAGLTLAFNLLVLPFVLDRLGADLYGAWIALSALVAVGSLADLGIGTEVARRVAAARGSEDPAALSRVVHLGTTSMTVMVLPVLVLAILAAPWLSDLVLPGGVSGYDGSDLAWVVRVLIAVMAVNLVLGAHFATLRGVQRSDRQVMAQVAALVPYTVVLVVGIQVGWGLWALVAAHVTMAVAAAAMQWAALRRLLPALRPRLVRASGHTLTAYFSLSVLALVSQVSDVVDSQWDKLVIAHVIGPVSVTDFHVGTMLVLQAKVLALLPLAPLLAGISELRVSRSVEALELQRKLMKGAAVTGAVVLGGVFLFAPSFLLLWLGPDYGQSGTIARIFTVAVALNVLAAPLGIQAFGEGRHGVAAWSALTNMVVNAIASLVLTIQVGVYGAVLGSVVGTLAGVVVLLVLARRRLAAWLPPPWAAPLTAVVLVALVLATGLDATSSWVVLVLSAVAYTVLAGVVASRAERLPLSDVLTLVRRRSAGA